MTIVVMTALVVSIGVGLMYRLAPRARESAEVVLEIYERALSNSDKKIVSLEADLKKFKNRIRRGSRGKGGGGSRVIKPKSDKEIREMQDAKKGTGSLRKGKERERRQKKEAAREAARETFLHSFERV